MNPKLQLGVSSLVVKVSKFLAFLPSSVLLVRQRKHKHKLMHKKLKEFDTVESVDVVMELASHGCICLGGLLFVLLSENRHLQQREQKCFQFVCQILKRMFLHGMNLVSCLEV